MRYHFLAFALVARGTDRLRSNATRAYANKKFQRATKSFEFAMGNEHINWEAYFDAIEDQLMATTYLIEHMKSVFTTRIIIETPRHKYP